MLLGEYLGLEALLEEVKAKAYANMHPDGAQDDERPAAAAFDEEVGSLADAVASKVLPARYFAPAEPTPPPPPERVVKALMPAPSGCAPCSRTVTSNMERRDTDRTMGKLQPARRSRSRASL